MGSPEIGEELTPSRVPAGRPRSHRDASREAGAEATATRGIPRGNKLTPPPPGALPAPLRRRAVRGGFPHRSVVPARWDGSWAGREAWVIAESPDTRSS